MNRFVRQAARHILMDGQTVLPKKHYPKSNLENDNRLHRQMMRCTTLRFFHPDGGVSNLRLCA